MTTSFVQSASIHSTLTQLARETEAFREQAAHATQARLDLPKISHVELLSAVQQAQQAHGSFVKGKELLEQQIRQLQKQWDEERAELAACIQQGRDWQQEEKQAKKKWAVEMEASLLSLERALKENVLPLEDDQVREAYEKQEAMKAKLQAMKEEQLMCREKLLAQEKVGVRERCHETVRSRS